MIVVVITLLVIGCLFGGSPGVDAASCTTATTCQYTDFTLPSCISNVCNCINSSFTPVRTGCAMKLVKPVITPLTGRSNQVVSGQSFTLTCVVSGATKYEWYLGGTLITGAASATYSPSSTASSTNVGSFTCKGLITDTVITSEMSDSFKVELLGTGGLTTSSVKPTIYVPATAVETGAQVTLNCYNIPMGYDNTVVTYQVSGTDTTSPVTISDTNAGKDVTCTIPASSGGVTYSSPVSAAGKLPSIITNVQSASVTVNGQTLAEVADYATITMLQLTCTISPLDIYFTSTLVYAWQKDGSEISGATAATYKPTATATYSCSVKVGSLTAVLSSNKVKVTISDTYVVATLTSSSTKPVKGGRVILTCGDIRTDTVTYMWYIGTNLIDRQYDRKLQIDNFDTADNGDYSCRIVKNLFVAISNSITLTSQSTIETPSISVYGCGTLLGEKGDYWLTCYTASETIGMTYVWTVGGKTSSVTSKYYSLPAITSSNNGDYICAAKFGSVTSSNSATKTVEVTDPGLRCYHDNECIAAKTGYSGTCDVNDRCLCSDGYSAKGEKCTNGVTIVFGSILMILSTFIFTRFI